MAKFQRSLTATLAAAALLGSLAFSANAQPAPHVGPAPHSEARRAQPVDIAQVHAQRNERLQTLLQLQPSQQAAWEQYLKATTPTPRAHAAGAAGARTDWRQLTTPQRLDQAQKLRKERNAHMEQREQATRNFYNSLNASQQKAFDTLTVPRAGHHQAGHRGHRMEKHRHAHLGQGPAGHGHHAAPAQAATAH